MRRPPLDLLGRNLRRFRRDPLGVLRRVRDEHGDVAPFRLGLLEFVLVNHPDLIKDVLVTSGHKFVKGLGLQRAKFLLGDGLLTSEGECHKRHRHLIQPAFQRDNILRYGPIMAGCAAATRERWRPGEEMDIAQEMTRLTLAIAGQTLFQTDVETEADGIGEALQRSIEAFKLGTALPTARLLYHLPLPSIRRFKRARAQLDALIFRLIRERRGEGKDRGDLLSMLLFTQDPDGQTPALSDPEVRHQALTLLLAGYETTAVALTWTWYLLAQHPAAERRLHEELDHVLGHRVPSAADVSALVYTRMLLTEAIRQYPPAWLISRMAVEPHDLGGYRVRPGVNVFISAYLLHHDARYFQNPSTFEPERWAPGTEASRAPFTYLPFGAGPRTCIGESFAWMEGILVIATLAQRWRLRLVPGHPVEPHPVVTLRPKHGVWMKLEPRS